MRTNLYSRWIKKTFGLEQKRSKRQAFHRSLKPKLEVLEDRLVPAVYTVNGLTDSGTGTGFSGDLRYCINQCNGDTSPDTIQFNIGTGGVQTIALTSALPTITNSVTIDGWSQSGFAETPLIELNGANAGPGANGLAITAGDSTVRGLVIDQFGQNGIFLSGGGNDLIAGNYIGTAVSGTVSQGNGLNGILIESANNTIGGLTVTPGSGAGNVISGNNGSFQAGGIDIVNASDNLVEGNLIGTNEAGTRALANVGNGIFVTGSSTGNIVGGTAAGARNIVAGNIKTGIQFLSGPTSNSVLDNYVGTDITGTFAIGNESNGVLLSHSANGNTIEGNVVSGNGSTAAGGVNIIDSNSNVVQGNFIGTDYTGTTSTGADGRPLGNLGGGAGVAIQNDTGNTASGNTIGGTTAADANVIAGNLEAGVWFDALNVDNNLLEGNIIRGNTGNGVQLTPFGSNAGGGMNNTITNNVISDNSLNGIVATGSNTTGNLLTGNSIYDNGGLGIDLGGDGVTANTPGGPHVGPNDLQNFPVLTAAASGSDLLVSGTLNSSASTAFTIDVYASPTADLSGYGQGQYYLGATTVTTDASGNASFAAAFSAAALPGAVIPAGWDISATATDPSGNTSEFSADVMAAARNALQPALTNGGTVAIQTTTADQAHAIFAAVNALDQATTPTSTIVLNLGGQTIQDTVVNMPSQVTLQIVNGTFVGGSPALEVDSGQLLISGSTFSNTTDAPTILVTGGSLTLRNDTIQESTGFTDASISITGGTVDLGSASDPGGNTLNVNGTGELVHNTTANFVTTDSSDTFEVNGTALTAGNLSFTQLTSSVATSTYGQNITLRATVRLNTPPEAAAPSPSQPAGTPSPTVTFYDGDPANGVVLGTDTLSTGGSAITATFSTNSLGIGTHTVYAVYSGDSSYCFSIDSIGLRVTALPTLTLSGSNHVDQGATYELNLGPVVDANPYDSVKQYIVNWGDGSDSITDDRDLYYLNNTLQHTYTSAGVYQISVDLTEQSVFPDLTFGGGTVTDPNLASVGPGPVGLAPGINSEGLGVAVDPTTGGLVQVAVNTAGFYLVRYNADGTLDTAFGNGTGQVALSGLNWIGRIAIDASGRILIPVYGFSVGRFNSDGSPDTTFGSNGVLTLNLGEYSSPDRPPEFDGIALDSQGNILLTGVSWNPSTSSYGNGVLVRLTPSDALDTSFGGGTGMVSTIFPHANNVAVDPTTGDIVVFSTDDYDNNQYLERYQSDGTLDTTFGNGTGWVSTTSTPGIVNDTNTIVNGAMAIDSSGRIVMAGNSENSGVSVVVRYNPDGTVDQSFGYDLGVNGIERTSIGADGLTLDSQGRIVLSGILGGNTALERLDVVTPDGPFLDVASTTVTVNNVAPTVSIASQTGVTFAPYTINAFGNGADYTFADQATDAQGRTYVPGLLNDGQVTVTRYNPDGSIDTSFGSGGTATSAPDPTNPDFDGLNNGPAVALDSQGRILVTASYYDDYNDNNVSILARFTPDGTADPTFGDNFAPAPTAVGAGTAVTLAGPFSDPGGADDVPYSYSWTVSADKGDSIPGASGSVSNYTGSVPDFSFTTAAGRSYTVTLSVADKYGAVGTSSTTITVAAPTASILGQQTNITLSGVSDIYGVAIDAAGNRYVAESGPGDVAVFAPGSTTPTSYLTGISNATYFAFDHAGNLFVDGAFTSGLWEFAAGSTTPTAALSGVDNPANMAVDANGDLFVANYGGFPDNGGSTVSEFAPGSTMPTATLTGLSTPYALAFDASGDLFVSNFANGTVSEFTPGSTTPTATLTGLNQPIALAFDAEGNLFVANFGSSTVSEFAPGSTSPTATLTGVSSPSDMGFDAGGDLIVLNRFGTTASEFAPGSTVPTATLTGLSGPFRMAFDSRGDLYVTNYDSSTVSEFGPLSPPSRANAGLPVTLSGDFTYPTGVPGAPFTYTWSVTDDNGDVVPGATGQLTDSSANSIPDFTFTPAYNGTYTVTLTVTDQYGVVSAPATDVITVVGPTAHITQPTATGSTAGFTLTASDPTLADQAAGFTYTINWGDGTTPQAISPTANNGSGVSVNHTFAGDGSYLVSVTATNRDGAVSPVASSLVVLTSRGGDSIDVRGGASSGQVFESVDGVPLPPSDRRTRPTDLVLVSGQGGNDTFTVDFGSTLTIPIALFGSNSAGDTLTVNGDNSATNVITKTTGQITWGSPVTETVSRSGVPNTIVNANGTSQNYINDPGGSTTINGGTGANTITITATTGNGVVINGGASSNTYIVDLGSLAGPVTIQNNNSAATNNLVVNGAAGNNTIAASGNQVTSGTQTITDTAALTNLTVNGGSGNNQVTVSSFSVPIQNLALNGGGGSNTFILNNVGSTVGALAISGGSGGPGTTQVQVQGSLPAQVTVPANSAPVVNLGTSGAVNVFNAFTRSAAFVATGSAFTATVDYGDDSGARSLTLNADKSFSLNHVYVAVGSYTVTVQVVDGLGDIGAGTMTVAVSLIANSIYVVNAQATSGALTISGNASIKLPGALVVESSSGSAILASGNAQITAAGGVQVVGGVSKSGNASVTKTGTPGETGDPLSSLTAPTPPSYTGTPIAENLSGNSTASISQGLYSQITVSGNAKLTLNPGVYVIGAGGVSISGNATLTGSGVTYIVEGGGFTVSGNAGISGSNVLIVNAGSNYPNPAIAGETFGGVTLSGNGSFSLNAATTGAYAGILIYQARDNTRALSISGNAMAGITGTIYAAHALLTMSGNASLQNPLVVGTLNLSGNVAVTQLAQGANGAGDAAGLADTLVAGNLEFYINDPSGAFTPDELARIGAAVSGWDALLAPYNVTIAQVSDASLANLIVDTGTTSASGSTADGVLGCFNGAAGEITILQGWNWYAGADPAQIGQSQYDFQTTVTHEFGHALGLGHSADPNSPMFESLGTGQVRRVMSVADLNIPDPPTGADPLRAALSVSKAVIDSAFRNGGTMAFADPPSFVVMPSVGSGASEYVSPSHPLYATNSQSLGDFGGVAMGRDSKPVGKGANFSIPVEWFRGIGDFQGLERDVSPILNDGVEIIPSTVAGDVVFVALGTENELVILNQPSTDQPGQSDQNAAVDAVFALMAADTDEFGDI